MDFDGAYRPNTSPPAYRSEGRKPVIPRLDGKGLK